jgi:glycosyltransferase involved in cell wall biosynthesis
MIALRILILTPWPFRVPRNGGQLRAAAVVQAYRSAGHEVHSAGLYDPARVSPGEVWPEDVQLSPGVITIMQKLSAREGRSEMAFWFAVAAARDSVAAFAAAVRAARPDVLQFEEPALWPIVRRLRADGVLDRVAIVHSSYNFETQAWQHRSVPGAQVTLETLRDIATLEQEVAAFCDLVITVSESDAREFRSLGAKQVCVAANGVRSLPCTDGRAVDAYISPDTSYALFVSSAHPPNAHGLVDMAAVTKDHPIRHGEILICGRVGSLVRAASNFQKAGRVLERARFIGWVDDTLLGALYAKAKVVILPKTLSGGSNLKTAEALASGRPVVATSRAFEGFESFQELPGVTIADDADLFWRAVDGFLSGDIPNILRPPEAMRGLLWKDCLEPMVRATEALIVRPLVTA